MELVKLTNDLSNSLTMSFFFVSTLFNETKDWSIDPIIWHISELLMDMPDISPREAAKLKGRRRKRAS